MIEAKVKSDFTHYIVDGDDEESICLNFEKGEVVWIVAVVDNKEYASIKAFVIVFAIEGEGYDCMTVDISLIETVENSVFELSHEIPHFENGCK